MPGSPASPEDLDLLLVRCFTVLAEHGNFGRAATALHITPSSLSRRISRLEQQLGSRLLERTPQGSKLTEAGEVFLPLARTVLDSAARAAARTRAAGRLGRITVGYIGNIIVTPAVRELRRRHPDADVRTLHLPWHAPHTALLEHRVDVVVARLPFPTDHLRVTVLHDEPRVVAMPLDHRLAGRESVTLDDIAHEPLTRASDPVWDAFWRIDPRPDGSRAPEGPYAEGIEDKAELVAGGQALAIIPGSARLGAPRPDLTTVPLEGVGPCHVVLATRAEDRGRLVSAFRTYAEAHLRGPE